MPQIWLTYDELGALLGCDGAAAREAAAGRPLDRRRCRDGRTRAKLDLLLTEQWLDMLVLHWAGRQVAACVDDLDRMRCLMAAPTFDAAVDEVAAAAKDVAADPCSTQKQSA